MASSSGRRSGSSGSSSSRKRVVIGADETVRVRYKKNRPEVESERKKSPRQTQRASDSERAGGRVPKVAPAARKVANQKRDERDRRRRQIAQRRILLALAAVAAVVALAAGLVALWQAPLFVVQSIKVVGTSHLTSADVIKLADVGSDTTLLKLPKAQIAKRIASSPWVSSVRLSRSFPHTLVISLTERVPAALVDTGAKGVWLVTRDGWWLEQHSTEPTGALLLIKSVPGLAPDAGSQNSSAILSNAIAVDAGISPQLRTQVKFISAETIEKTMLVLKNQVQIFVGDADEIGKKDLIARAILSKEKNIVYINVRVTDRPTWRGLSPTN